MRKENERMRERETDDEVSTEREKHFALKTGISVYGGFAGSDSSIEKRDIQANATILSGDLGTMDDSSDNSYHVFYHTSVFPPLDSL